ncbi:NADH-quinone oxidoreductase subunit J [Desulfoluna sp.]|uniref:NADH-quinone oxidoreductase subunit J family protein n=1 Tax=Desulfoluna sp. TaxID=2045199 RepID=UPI00260811FF|nr:NADH-quinone oxidoreductase subunit J [Desulfoluna sp.]
MNLMMEVLFFGFVVLTMTGALLAVRAKILMHGVLGLAVSLLGVAGLYLYLGSPFLTLMQVLIYVGAICVVLVFGIMVGYTPNEVAEKVPMGRNALLGLLASGSAAFFLMVMVLGRTHWVPAAHRVGDFSIEHVGESLLLTWCLAFEMISVVLLIAIVGAIILARGGREEGSQ